MRNILKNYQNWNERCALELALSTGEPSIHQNDAPIYSWTSIKCQKFFSIFSFSFSIRFSFSVRCGPLQTWCNRIESDTWDRGMVRLAAVSIVYARCVCQRHRCAPCHAPSVFGSQCGSQKVAHPLRRRHVSTLFSLPTRPRLASDRRQGCHVFFESSNAIHTLLHTIHTLMLCGRGSCA